MSVSNITPSPLSEKRILSSHNAIYTYLEYVLLLLVAGLGILGTVYVFSSTSNNSNPNPLYGTAMVAGASHNWSVSDDTKEKFKDYIEMDGDRRVDSKIRFTLKQDNKASRYVLEMGNGERVILTQQWFDYTYREVGEYLLEIKEIRKNLIYTLASKKIKIKSAN